MEGEQQVNEASAGEPQVEQVPKRRVGEKIPSFLTWVLSAFAFLAPIFVIPNAAVSLDASKTWLLLSTVLVGGLLVLVHLLLRGELFLSRHLVSYGLKGVLVATFLSAVLSPQVVVSVMGSGSQAGTLSTIGLFVVLACLSMLAFRDRAAIFRLILAVFGGFTVLAVFHGMRLLFGADMFSFGVFESPVFSLAGKWNDLAVLSGLILILSVVAEYYFRKNTMVLWTSRVFAAVSVFFLLMIDFWILWLVLAAVIAVFAVRTLATLSEGKRTFSFTTISYVAVGAVIVSIGFGYLFRFPIGGTTLPQIIVDGLSPQRYAEIVLPPGLTLGIAKDVWSEGARSAILGTGPNRFSNAYFMHKPEGINATALWDSSFESGFSHITTFVATGGILGALAWVFLVLASFFLLWKLFREDREGVRAYLGYSIGLGTLYLLLVCMVYLPNISTTGLLFLFIGALLGMISGEGAGKSWRLTLPSAKGWGVALVPVIVLLALGLFLWAFEVASALRSERAYQESRILTNRGENKEALSAVSQAESFGTRDSQYRLMTDIHLLELQRVLSEAPSSPEALQNKVRELATSATESSQKAAEWDPSNYLNHVSRASVGDLFATLNVDVPVTASAARDAYIDALRLNPSSPRIEFAVGRVELLLGNREGAKLHLGKARDLRPAYPEAIAALAELNRQDGNMDKAIEIATAGLQSDPSNFIISFQLGVLYYTNQDYDRAIAAFSNAIATNPYYANAKYFLGVSYARKGDKTAAMKQFEEVRALNPDNEEIGRVIRNLSAGRDPLADQ